MQKKIVRKKGSSYKQKKGEVKKKIIFFNSIKSLVINLILVSYLCNLSLYTKVAYLTYLTCLHQVAYLICTLAVLSVHY